MEIYYELHETVSLLLIYNVAQLLWIQISSSFFFLQIFSPGFILSPWPMVLSETGLGRRQSKCALWGRLCTLHCSVFTVFFPSCRVYHRRNPQVVTRYRRRGWNLFSIWNEKLLQEK